MEVRMMSRNASASVKPWQHVVAVLLLAACRPATPAVEAPPATAPAPSADEPLINTAWKLTHLGDEPVLTTADQRAAHIVLHADSARVSGFAGCNQLAGTYQAAGTALTFGPLATTRMACPTTMAAETAFLAALGEARAWRIVGDQLDLLDAAGRVVARFAATHLP
jgi:heat shock protein HslJ